MQFIKFNTQTAKQGNRFFRFQTYWQSIIENRCILVYPSEARGFLVLIVGVLAAAQTVPSGQTESVCIAQQSIWKQGIEFRHALRPPGVDVEVSPIPTPGFAGAPTPLAYFVGIHNYSQGRIEADPAQWRLLWTEKTQALPTVKWGSPDSSNHSDDPHCLPSNRQPGLCTSRSRNRKTPRLSSCSVQIKVVRSRFRLPFRGYPWLSCHE